MSTTYIENKYGKFYFVHGMSIRGNMDVFRDSLSGHVLFRFYTNSAETVDQYYCMSGKVYLKPLTTLYAGGERYITFYTRLVNSLDVKRLVIVLKDGRLYSIDKAEFHKIAYWDVQDTGALSLTRVKVRDLDPFRVLGEAIGSPIGGKGVTDNEDDDDDSTAQWDSAFAARNDDAPALADPLIDDVDTFEEFQKKIIDVTTRRY